MPDDETNESEHPEGSDLRHLREKAKRADEAEARAAEAERRAAFAEAGVPVAGVGRLFRDAYKGDLTTEAVQAAMAEYGIDKGAAADHEDLSPEEREQHRRIAEPGSGSSTDTGQIDAADAIREATSAEEVMRIVRAADIRSSRSGIKL